jgi:galactose oxidase
MMVRSAVPFFCGVVVPSLLALGCSSEPADDARPFSLVVPPDGERAWSFGTGSSVTGTYFQLKSVSSSLCVDISKASAVDGTSAIQYACSSGKNQRFYFRALSSTTYQLSAQHSAKCLQTNGGSTADGAAIVQEPCARSGPGLTGSVFTVTRVGTTTPARYQLSPSPGQCLESPNGTHLTPLVQHACSTATKFLWNFEPVAPVAQSDTTGRWSQVFGIPGMVPISAANLRNGKVLLWASWQGLYFGGTGAVEQTVTAVFDPANAAAPVVQTVTGVHNMFCPGTDMLADGRVLVAGGDNERTNRTDIYDPMTGTWSPGGNMNQQRWYNATVTLPDGRALTLGGNRTSGQSGNGEIYDPSTNTWTMMDGITMSSLTTGASPDSRAMEHPRMFVSPDGRIFVPGPTPNMQWFTLAGQGTVTPAGPRGDDEFSQNDVTVMYEVGKLLKAGGNINYDRTNATFTPSSQNSYLIDINSGAAVVTKIAPMLYPRDFANGVVLPDGRVFVAGGLDNAKGFSDRGNIKAAEMFDPVAQTWTELPPMATPRPYHSIVLLLADARVLVGGGGLCPGGPCSVNHTNVEIYSPPYLFAGGRPVITAAPATIASDGSTFQVTATGAVTSFSLIRMGSVTHTVDTDQRYMKLVATGSAGAWTLTAPANHNVAPPGYYMLFALAGGIPSVAAIVQVV